MASEGNIATPEVSIVIPNFNHAPFLSQRIDSILNQTFQDFEIIIIDDCSTDDSLAVIERYCNNPKIKKIIKNSINSGSPISQWQKGVELCSGKYIWIAESDDVAEPDFLDTLVSAIEKEESSICYCKSISINENGEQIESVKWLDELDENKWQRSFSSDGYKEFKEFHIYRNTIINASSAIFRRDLFPGNIEPYKHLKYSGDWIIWAEIMLKGKVTYVDRPLNYFRRHPASVFNQSAGVSKDYQKTKDIFEAITFFQSKADREKININKYKWALKILPFWISQKNIFSAQIWLPPIPNRFLAKYYRILFSTILQKGLKKITSLWSITY